MPTRVLSKNSQRNTMSILKSDPRMSAVARTKQMSIETAAREARYVLAKIAKQRRCHTIFLAHHADDLVETFLINLFAALVSPVSPPCARFIRRIDNVDLTIVRPLLEFGATRLTVRAKVSPEIP
jgi:tRNA(Ile)-lysidine synthase